MTLFIIILIVNIIFLFIIKKYSREIYKKVMKDFMIILLSFIISFLMVIVIFYNLIELKIFLIIWFIFLCNGAFNMILLYVFPIPLLFTIIMLNKRKKVNK